ncbi:MAG: 2-C-methyl-D-erythritol 2,4-cyclodiphosphate synthase [Firmicutes bacterium]|nr:2-C-methyl-D-erythritol 2,4-cyclodiphosphate synthase [Bacillota bacterium]
MYKDKKVTAIVTAAGKGSRMGASLPKQFLKIGSKTILEKAILPFEKADFIDQIIVVSGAEFVEVCKGLCAGITKLKAVVEGGKERQDSVNNALKLVEDGYVLIHDGARPYITEKVILNVLEDVSKVGAAVAAVPVKDTIRQQTDEGGKTLKRSELYSVQTPQGFEVSLIKEAFRKAFEDGFYGTDDAGLVDRMGKEVAVSEGDYRNIKITTKEDMPVEVRVGTGFDVHRLVEGRKCIVCGVDIPFDRGLLGHSDADVALHALMDAMLGAAALGDIGKHFPDTDPKYKGISSIKLLEYVNQFIAEEGYTLGNCDVTIMAQKPKMLPYIGQMRENIAEALNIPIGAVNVKATTTEKLGFVGREEGIAAEAVCILNRG